MKHWLRVHLLPGGPTRGAFWSLLILFIVVIILTAGSYSLSVRAINNSQHKWCTTLALLTSQPVAKPPDPKANVSRERAYVFYEHLKELERDFGCT